ncbi:PAS domain S-box-containing protein [Burkholderia sp. D7]|nr:PAS domain S-box-containing protein [Burkholderia sp. D7]
MFDMRLNFVRKILQAWFGQRDSLRIALSSVGDVVITTDTDGNVSFLSPAAQHLTGWTQADALGNALHSILKVVHEDGRFAAEDPAAKALREGVAVEWASHTRLIGKDGAQMPVAGRAAPIRDARGNVAGTVLVFQNMTGRSGQGRHAQDPLSYAERIIAAIRAPLLVLDESLQVKMANRSFYQTFRVTQDDTEGDLIYDLGDGQWTRPDVRALLDGVQSGGQAFSDCYVEHSFPAIGERTMRLNARRLELDNSRPGFILVEIEDITERRQAESALRASEVQYRRLFQSAKDGILILDAITLKIIDANQFITDLLGYSQDELLGKELWQIGFFRDKSDSQAAYRELQERGYIRYDHLPLETKNGETAEVEFISNVYLADNRAVAQCNIRDISERSKLERTLQEQTEALADLHHRKDEFLAMLSHELRNPLAPISNAVRLLRLYKNEDPIQQRVRIIIERQVVQLTRLVDDLMEVSRITTGRIKLRREVVAMSAIVEHAVETTRPLMDQRRQQLEVSLLQDPIWLYADADRLEQVAVNLLANAAKYTDEGGQIWLSVEREGDECVMRLRDTGVGIAPELLPHVFDLFTQAERSLDRSRGGLGIGLALVQRLVEMHGGRVEVHSALGEGSEFVIRLPVAAEPAAPSLKPPLLRGRTAGVAPHGLRVLVVDDNVDTADSLTLLVELLDHDVRTAYDGPTALEIAVEYRPNVALLDIGLPGLNGYEVATRIRQQAGLGGIVLVAITGYGQESDRQLATQAGFDHHLVKPVDFDRVQRILATTPVDNLTSARRVFM